MHDEAVMDDPMVKLWIDSCQSCERVCASTIAHCLELGGRHASTEHITALRDCARLCATARDFLVRGSEQRELIFAVCADLCAKCGRECEQFLGDVMMVRCADACRKCVGACLEMAELARNHYWPQGEPHHSVQ